MNSPDTELLLKLGWGAQLQHEAVPITQAKQLYSTSALCVFPGIKTYKTLFFSLYQTSKPLQGLAAFTTESCRTVW